MTLEKQFESAVIVITCIVMAFMIVLVASIVHADEIPQDRAINAIIGEAEGEGAIGMEAVACAIRNRGTLKGVYGEKAPRVVKKLYSEKIYDQAVSAWKASENTEMCEGLVHGANMWENVVAFGKPYWYNSVVKTVTIRNQTFFREKRHVTKED